MKASQDKCHQFISKNENVSMYIGPLENKNTNCETLLGFKVNSKLNFNELLGGIIKKTSRKTNALSTITSFMNIRKRGILLNPSYNMAIVLWFGCLRAVQLTARLTVYTKESCVYRGFKSL